jgi:hypothetical protein
MATKKKKKLPKEVEDFLTAYREWYEKYQQAQTQDDSGSNPGGPPPPPPGHP